MEPLPDFRYHPDPVATGSVERSEQRCRACQRARGFIYTGPVYAEEELVDAFCPWCIADGSAADRFDAEFVESEIDEIMYRTPGFSGWQEEQWLEHCDDGCAFLGPVGWDVLGHRPDAVEVLRREYLSYGWSDEQVEGFLESLSREGSPTAYLFRCLHCGTHLAYADFD